MHRDRTFLILVALFALLLGNGSAHSHVDPGNQPGGGEPPAGQVQLNENNFPDMLQKLGYKVEAKQNADKEAYWIITTQQEGWGFAVEVQPQRHKQTKQIIGFWLISNLGGPLNNPAALSAPALLKLLQKNHEMAPFFFSYNAASKHLAMNYEYPSGTIDQKGLKAQFDTLFSKIRETYSLWKTDTVVVKGGAVKPPIPAPGVANLAGTKWTGTETLQGYDKLTFQFAAGGKATMFDKDGNTPGTWTQTGNKVTLSFYQGEVGYTGTINGNAMTGSGRNTETVWTFSLKKQN